ncbi:MAG TPA: hypothetical protein VKV26_07235 [Dehalococcoidia bacterium]|nr:hypothetical protein [Dehalococcoidia bacterium]
MISLTTQHPTRRQVRRLGLAGAALLLTAAATTGVVWRVHSPTSHAAVHRDASITQPGAVLPARTSDRGVSTAVSRRTASAALVPQVWLVGTPAQAAQLQQQLADDAATRAQAGGGDLAAQLVTVTTAAEADAVFQDLNTANLARAAAGLAPIALVDLR